MNPFDAIEFLFAGAATLFDVIVLLVLLDRINRRHVAPWLKLLVLAAATYHACYFFRILLNDSTSSIARTGDKLLMLSLAASLWLMPCAMAHAAYDLTFKRSKERVGRSMKEYAFYLPMFTLVYCGWLIATNDTRSFVEAIEPLKWTYIAFLFAVNSGAAVLFSMQAKIAHRHEEKAFFYWVSALLVIASIIAGIYASTPANHYSERTTRLIICSIPLLMAGLFSWYCLKQKLVRLIIEPTYVYGALVLLLLLTHRVVATPIFVWMRTKVNIDFLVIEVVGVATLIWVVPTLRYRVAESLRFLLSSNAFSVRDALRRISLEMSRFPGLSPEPLCQSFVDLLAHKLELREAFLIVNAHCDGKEFQCFQNHSLSKSSIHGTAVKEIDDAISSRDLETLQLVYRWILQKGFQTDRAIIRGDSMPDEIESMIETLQIDSIIPFEYRSVRGILLLGGRLDRDRLAEEQLLSVAALSDQLAAHIQGCYEQQLRLQSQRENLQKEKLSTLGLMSNAIAHELKNPLSSMRTIATLVAEAHHEDNRTTQDIELIIQQIDRLITSTKRLLDFGKLPSETNLCVEVDTVIFNVLQIIDLLAKQHRISLDLMLNTKSVRARIDEASLSDLIFNLVKNAIEAIVDQKAGTDPLRQRHDSRITVQTELKQESIVIKVTDNGPGISAKCRENLFEPFKSSKEYGSGLGLFIVHERVTTLGGKIECHSDPESGTLFTVYLPIEKPEASTVEFSRATYT